MEERKGDSSVAFFVGEGGRGACPAKLFQRLFRVPDIRVTKCSKEMLVSDATGLHSPSWLK